MMCDCLLYCQPCSLLQSHPAPVQLFNVTNIPLKNIFYIADDHLNAICFHFVKGILTPLLQSLTRKVWETCSLVTVKSVEVILNTWFSLDSL